jgi:hypothetical protein
MTCEEVRERLDAWVAGELDAGEAALVEAHLASCAACRDEEAAWRDLRARTAALPRSIEPPRDLWGDIDRALDAAPAVAVDAAIAGSVPRRARLRLPALAAAAVLRVVVTAALTTFFLRTSDTAMARKLKGMQPTVEPAGPTSEELLRALAAQGVPPETMAIVQRNLAVIDVAIAELETALAEDPDNEELARMLVSVHRQRAELVEGAVRAKEDG